MSSIDTRFDFRLYQDPRTPRAIAPRKAPAQTVIATIALAGVALSCGWVLIAHLVAGEETTVVAAAPDAAESVPVAASVAAPAATAAAAPSERIRRAYAALFDSRVTLGAHPDTFAPRVASAAPSVAQAPVAAAAPMQVASLNETTPAPVIPLPVPRPAELRLPSTAAPAGSDAVQRLAQGNKTAVIASLEADAPRESEEPSTFQKLFGRLTSSTPALAYAAPDGGLPGERRPSLAGRIIDRYTAVYDISARTVYMPDGSKLEAHSGLGSLLDDPSHAHVRMRGVTPPHIYDLTLRESLFHGVQALRLNPVGGEGNVFGRTGLLAHTYMLGPNGDSNGCVSFRNYDAFLRAYLKQEIKHLLVVPRMS